MTRRRNAQQELRPVYVRPSLDRRARAAQRDWCGAVFRGERYRAKPGDFDPLWLRLGLRAFLIESRAGWVVSNPIYDQLLRRDPAADPSLPGPKWLWEVYHWHRGRGLVTLPGVARALELMSEARRADETFDCPAPQPSAPVSSPAQGLLFSAEGA
ncbi:hypothetical protein D3C86_878150 [compost metagenome]